MGFLTVEDIDALVGGSNNMTYAQKMEIVKECKSQLIGYFEQAYLKSSSTPDKSYSRQAATMCIATAIAYSAGGDGLISRAEYEFVKEMFGESDDYDIRYHMQISGGYETFCYQLSSNKGKFWTDNFIEKAKYLNLGDKKSVAAFMFLFASSDGEITEAEKRSILDLLNKI